MKIQKDYKTYKEFRKWVFSIIGNVCIRCGLVDENSLEIDHSDRTLKSFDISRMWASKSKDEMLEELNKCQPLCKTCHKEKTVLEMRELMLQQGVTHGTEYAWSKLKCRCSECLLGRKLYYPIRNAKRRKTDQVRGTYDMSGRHGASKYKRGCRCGVCREGHTLQQRSYRTKKL